MTRSGALLLLAAMALGCGGEAKKPPPMTCAGLCAPTQPGRVGVIGPPDGEGGAAGETGTNGSPVRLRGEVRVLNDIVSLAATPFFDPATILVEGEPMTVTGQWNGSDPFSIDGVRRASVVWAQVTPSTGDALRTLQPLDTRTPDASGVVTTVLTVVRESEIDAAYNVLSLPIQRDMDKAQAILLVLKSGHPAAGVRVVALGAEVVIYAANGNFSDTATSTDASGIVLLANVPAVPWPGSGVSVTLAGAAMGNWDVQLVSGGVTLVGVGD